MKYRGICLNCNWKGPWRSSSEQAENDALQHQLAYPTHVTDIEVQQS